MTKHRLLPSLCLLLSLLLAPAAARAAPRGGRVPGQPAATAGESAPDAASPDAAAPPPADAPLAAPRAEASGPAPAGPRPEEGGPRLAQDPAASPPGAAARPSRALPPPHVRSSLAMAVGGLFPLSAGPTMPRFALQLSGPLELAALERGSAARVEWLATAAFSYSGRELVGFTGTSQESTLGTELMPGARLLYPVHPRLNLSAEVSAGLSLVHSSATTRTSAGSLHASDLDWGAVARVAVGGQLPLDERLRLFIEPIAVQTYLLSGAGTAWSMQFGLAYAW